MLGPDERIAAYQATGRITLEVADELRNVVRIAREEARARYVEQTGASDPIPSGLGADGLRIMPTTDGGYAIDHNTLNRRVAGYYAGFQPGTHSITGRESFDASIAHNRQLIIEWDGIANSALNQRLFAVVGAPMAIAGAAASAPLILSGSALATATGLVSLDYGQSAVRGILNGSFEVRAPLAAPSSAWRPTIDMVRGPMP